MAQSRRKESRSQFVTELECALHEDRAQIAGDNETRLDRPATEESLDLGHAHLRSECWAAARHGTLRLARTARQRTPLHLARPPAAADARFTPSRCEFIE
jgi:hypothetical protein